MSNVITLDPKSPVVKDVVAQVRASLRDHKRYAAYVAAFGVTRETIGDHALAIARLVTKETAQTVRTEDGKKVRTTFGNAVQAAATGLRREFEAEESAPSTALLTSAGKKATREQVIAEWEAAQK